MDESLDVSKLGEPNLENFKSKGIFVHATYFKYLNKIRDKGLSRRDKAYIHLYSQLPNGAFNLPGHEKSPQILIYIDAAFAMQNGLTFYQCKTKKSVESELILSRGDPDGYIPARFFDRIVHISTDSTLLGHAEIKLMRDKWTQKEFERKQNASVVEAKKIDSMRATVDSTVALSTTKDAGEGVPGKNQLGNPRSSAKAKRTNIYLENLFQKKTDDQSKTDSLQSTSSDTKYRKARLKTVGGSRKKRICI